MAIINTIINLAQKKGKNLILSAQLLYTPMICQGQPWEAIGPIKPVKPGNPFGSGSGRMMSVASHPDNDQIYYCGGYVGGIFKTQDAGNHWDNLDPNKQLPLHTVSEIALDKRRQIPQRCLFIALGFKYQLFHKLKCHGIYMSPDEGQTWTSKTGDLFGKAEANDGHRLAINEIWVRSGTEVWAATNKGLYICQNITQSNPIWTRKIFPGSGDGIEPIYHINAKPINTISQYESDLDVILSGRHIYHTTDGGNNWKILLNSQTLGGDFNYATSAKYSTARNNRIIALTQTNGNTSTRINYCDNPDSPNPVWVSTASERFSQDWNLLNIACDPVYEDIVYISIQQASDPLLRYNIKTSNFTPIKINLAQDNDNAHTDVRDDLEFSSANSNYLLVPNDGMFSIYDCLNYTWKEIENHGLSTSYFIGFSSSPVTGKKIIGGRCDAGTIYRNAQGEWNPLCETCGGDGSYSLCIKESPQQDLMFAHVNAAKGGHTAWYSANATTPPFQIFGPMSVPEHGFFGFDNWTTTNMRRDYNKAEVFYNPLGFDLQLVEMPLNRKTIVTQNLVRPFYTTLDNTQARWWGFLTDFDVSCTNDQIIFVTYGGGNPTYDPSLASLYPVPSEIHKTTDGGNTWTQITSANAQGIQLYSDRLHVAISKVNPNIVYLGYHGYSDPSKRILKSYNGGVTWTNYTANLPQGMAVLAISSERYSKDAVYVGMENGVWYRDSTMSQWIHLNSGAMPNVYTDQIELNYNIDKIRVSGGMGIWEANLPCPTGGDQTVNELPASMPPDGDTYRTGGILTYNVNSSQNRTIHLRSATEIRITSDLIASNGTQLEARILPCFNTTAPTAYRSGIQSLSETIEPNNLEIRPEVQDLFLAYPNPTNQYVQIKFSDLSKIQELRLYNSLGLELQKWDSQIPQELNLEKYEDGQYLVVAIDKVGKKHTQRIVLLRWKTAQPTFEPPKDYPHKLKK